MTRDFEEEFRKSMNALHFRKEDKDRMHDRLLFRLRESVKGKENAMNKWTLKRSAAAIAACLMITGITAFAASKIAYYTASSRAGYEYKTASEMNAGNHGELPAVPETLGSGFAFAGGNPVNVEGKDESGSTAGKWKDLHAQYTDPSGKTVTLSLTAHIDEEDRSATEVRTISGIPVRFDQDEYLVLPDENAEPDEDVRARMESDDHFFVSYGSEQPETVIYRNMSFEKDGIGYILFTSDDIDRGTLYRMAAELIG